MAAKSNTKKIILWGSVIVLAGVGGFILYRRWKNKRGQQSQPMAETPAPAIETPATKTETPKPVSNPFKSKSELVNFQNWVLNTKGDKTILGKSGVDGVWGDNTAAAWVKYGSEWSAPIKGYTPRIYSWEKPIIRNPSLRPQTANPFQPIFRPQ